MYILYMCVCVCVYLCTYIYLTSAYEIDICLVTVSLKFLVVVYV